MNFSKGDKVVLGDAWTGQIGTVISATEKDCRVDFRYKGKYIRSFRQKDGAETNRGTRALVEYIHHVDAREIWLSEGRYLRAVASGYGDGSSLLTDLEDAIERYRAAKNAYDKEA